jgi:hypothetical protein
LVRSWTPEVVYTRDVIVSDCETPVIPSLMATSSSFAAPRRAKSLTLPSDLGDKLSGNDASYIPPYPHLWYYSDAQCYDSVYVVVRGAYDESVGGYVETPETMRVKHCNPVGQVGDYAANVNCSGVIDANHLVCDSVLSIDTITEIRQMPKEVYDEGMGAFITQCGDSTIIVRIDSIYTYTCIKKCTEVCDTFKLSGDTIIYYTEDSIVKDSCEIFELGAVDSLQLCLEDLCSFKIPDTLNIVMEATTKTGCDFIDTFQVLRLTVPREHTGDTFVSHGDTLQLFASALESNTSQWWNDPSEKYYNSIPHDLILDSKSRGNYNFDSLARFIGDTLPLYNHPTVFRGDTVDMVLNSERTFPEHNNYVCLTRDTVAIAVITGFRIGGYISYDSFWMPSKPGVQTLPPPENGLFVYHRPVNCVTVELYNSSGALVATTMSDSEGYYHFNGLYPPDKYVLQCSAPQKDLHLNSIDEGGISNGDAAQIQNWINERNTMPYRPADPTDGTPTKKTMVYVAANVDETPKGVGGGLANYDMGLDNTDVGQIQEFLVASASYRFISNEISNLGNMVDNWKFSNDTINLAQNEDSVHVYAVMVGDANLDYMPMLQPGVPDDELQKCAPAGVAATLKAKSSRSWKPQTTSFEIEDTIFVNGKDQFVNYPIVAKQSGDLLGMQLFVNIPDNVEVLQVSTGTKAMSLAHNIVGDRVLMSWLANGSIPISFKKGDVIVNLVLKINRSKSLKRLSQNFTFDSYEVTDKNLKRITKDFKVALPTIIIDNSMPITILDSIMEEEEEITDTFKPDKEIIPMILTDANIHASKIVTVIPNPIVDRSTDVTYSIAEEAVVTMKLFNLLGVEITTLIEGERQNVGVFRKKLTADNIPDGVYILRLEAVSENKRDISVEKIVVNR